YSKFVELFRNGCVISYIYTEFFRFLGSVEILFPKLIARIKQPKVYIVYNVSNSLLFFLRGTYLPRYAFLRSCKFYFGIVPFLFHTVPNLLRCVYTKHRVLQ